VTNVYDSAGRLAKQVDALSNKGCLYYGHGPANPSPADRPGVTPAPDAGTTVYVNARGNKTTYFFDTSFRTTDVVDALGNETHYTFEAAGGLCSPANNSNLCPVRDPLAHVTSFTYDSKGSVLTRTNALGRTWTSTYTPLNDVASERDPLQRTTEYGNNAAGNLTSVTRKDENSVRLATTTFGRNAQGDFTSITDANNHLTTFTYDAYGLPDRATDHLNNVTNRDFDSAGRLTCLIDAEGNQTAYTYEARNNVRFLPRCQEHRLRGGHVHRRRRRSR